MGQIRKAVLRDARGVAEVQVRSWKSTYRGIVAESFLQQLDAKEREQTWKNAIAQQILYVAESEDGSVVGYVVGGENRSEKYPDYKGECFAFYILEEYQHKGLGQQLLQSLVKDLQQQRIDSLLVLALEKNPYKKFYEKLGAQKIGVENVEIGWQLFKEAVYGWKDTQSIIDYRN